jgi:protein disulfide-isomerase
MADPRLTIEVWSDIVCPFCYIGKRNLESALRQFAHADRVDVIWRSFQLDPDAPIDPARKQNVYEYLAERKGITYEQSVRMHEDVTARALQAGLPYRFDKAIVFNTFHAHRLLQLAKMQGRANELKEKLMSAYFIDGRDCGEASTLEAIGREAGLSPSTLEELLDGNAFADNVRNDIKEAAELGIQGVPFFLFNRRWAISGAYPTESFLQALNQTYEAINS